MATMASELTCEKMSQCGCWFNEQSPYDTLDFRLATHAPDYMKLMRHFGAPDRLPGLH